MKKYLEKLPQEIQDLISLGGKLAYANNMPAYLVGGFVRDLLLGVKNLDLDIVVEGDGIRFAELLSAKLNSDLVRHKRFGTATIIPDKRLKIDIATARRERYPEPAHLPEVSRGTLKDDLFRRDFTINAMAISINRRDFGKIIDSFGGRQDLGGKKIRVLHNLSFIDDPTRILRAIRFEQRYNFKIEAETLRLLKEANVLKMLEKTQPHRLRDELILILKEERPLKSLLRLKGLTGFDFINQGLSLPKNALEFLKSCVNQIKWFQVRCPRRRKLDTWLIYFAGLLGPLNINSIKSICKKFALRRGEEKRIVTYKKAGSRFIRKLSSDATKPSEVYKFLEPLSYETIILIRAKFKNKDLRRNIEDFFGVYNGMRLHITGADLNKLGLTPGPYYQKIFHRVLDAKLNGLVKTKKEELALIRKVVSRPR
ncbi:MAG: CCA tRNA nucleotidyltransferase [Candidatus Omnitrophota bacterium]